MKKKNTLSKLPLVRQGKFPKSFMTGDEDDTNVLTEQIHIIDYIKPKDK